MLCSHTMLWICSPWPGLIYMRRLVGILAVFTARTAQFCMNCAANFGSTVLARTAAVAAVLAARTGQFWSVFCRPELPNSAAVLAAELGGSC